MIPTWVVPLWLAFMLGVAVWIVGAVAREGMGYRGKDQGDG